MKIHMGIVGLGAALTGCVAQPLPLPREAQSVVLQSTSSPSVTVRDPVLQMNADGRLRLVGFVVKRREAETTENTHLDVVFFDGANIPILERSTTFYPQRLTTGRRSPSRQGHYSLTFENVPADVARIAVRGHDEPHPTSKGDSI